MKKGHISTNTDKEKRIRLSGKKSNKIEITDADKTIWEDVSDLNGLVIPAILESKLNQTTSTIENCVKEKLQNKQ